MSCICFLVCHICTFQTPNIPFVTFVRSAVNCVYVFLCTLHLCLRLDINTLTQSCSKLHPVVNLAVCFSLSCCGRSSKPWGSPTTQAASAVSSVTRALTECPSPWTRKTRSTASKITTGEEHLLQRVRGTRCGFCGERVGTVTVRRQHNPFAGTG